jgi:hypothetical protein
VVVCLAAGLAADQAPDRAAGVLAEARKALGGEKLDAVKTVQATGRAKRLRGNNIVPREFEIAFELPDKYLRKDEFPAEEADPTSTGFNGAGLIQIPAPAAPMAMPPGAAAAAPGRPGGPPAPAPPTPEQLAAQRTARVNTVKQDFVRLSLGLFATSFSAYPVTFTWAAQAEAPQGKADVLDVKGAANFALRLLVNSETHLPIMVSWQLPPTNVVMIAEGQPQPASIAPGAVVVKAPAMPPASAAQDVKDAYAKEVQGLRAKAQATPVEHRLYFADYRDVDGVKWPFRLRRAIGVDTTEETTFDRVRINSKIDPKRFDVVK